MYIIVRLLKRIKIEKCFIALIHVIEYSNEEVINFAKVITSSTPNLGDSNTTSTHWTSCFGFQPVCNALLVKVVTAWSYNRACRF